MRAILIFLLLTLCLPTALCWTMESGIILEENETTITIIPEIEVQTDAYFDGDTFFFAPFGFEFDTNDGSSWQWNLTNWSAPLNVTFEGNASTYGTVRFEGFPGFYQVEGLLGYPTFTISGPTFTLNINPGQQTFTIRITNVATSGLLLALSSRFNTEQTTIASAVTLLDATGNPISGANIHHIILFPDGTIFQDRIMDESVIPGVYLANYSVQNEPSGPWTVIAQYGGTLASESVIKTSGVISGVLETALDSYVPLLVWGGAMLLLLWVEAFFPAIAAGLNLAAAIFPTPFWSIPASIMLFMIAIFLHVLAKIIARQGWFKTNNEG